MPDFSNKSSGATMMDGAPGGWGDAFAALPLEAAPGDGWARLSRSLDAHASRRGSARRERRTTWLIGVASAAVLALVAWSPLSRWLQADGAESHPPAVVADAVPGMRGPAGPVRAGSDEPRVASAPNVQAAPVVSQTIRTAPRPGHRKPARNSRAIAVHKPVAAGTAPASHQPGQAAPPSTQPGTGAAVAVVDLDALQKLQAQSAQLEALVSLARDDRVGNASSDLLSSELDAGIAVVDAALSQADLAAAQKQELWQQRVDLLQQLAGVEATSRWLAAQGASNSTLVAVD